MHPLGSVYLDGYGRLRNYYRDALDKLGVGVSLVRVGTFKSAAEPFIANGPSEAATQADTELYRALWATYVEGIERARQLTPGSTQALIDELPERLLAAQGDTARLALEARQVDALKTVDELRTLMIERRAHLQAGVFRRLPGSHHPGGRAHGRCGGRGGGRRRDR
jgi:protease-4